MTRLVEGTGGVESVAGVLTVSHDGYCDQEKTSASPCREEVMTVELGHQVRGATAGP